MDILTGTYYHSIDAKGRLSFPSKLRDILGASFMITRSIDSKCITVYSNAEWEKLSEKIAKIPMSKAGALKRWIFSNAAEVIPDRQGRILLPKEMRTWAGLENEAAIIGTDNKAEIWSKELWDKEQESFDSDDLKKQLELLDF